MATTHVVSLFLPITIKFEKRQLEEEPSPAEEAPLTHREQASHPPTNDGADSPERGSTAVPGSDEVMSSTPEAAAAAEQSPAEAGQEEQQQQQLPTTPGNPRALMRSDAHVPDWGTQATHNQPRSRAEPLPSGSILDYSQVQEDLRQADQQTTVTSDERVTSVALPEESDTDFEKWSVETALQGNGGLANAMRESNQDYLADITWHGTLGFPTDSMAAAIKADIADHLANEYQAQVVDVSDKDFHGLYNGYCKTILWPVFHYIIPDHPKSRAYLDHSWRFYKAVNQKFANRLIENYKRGDMIWIHDYHLLMVPRMVRDKLPDAQIGFFLHTPFPSSEVFRCLAKRVELLDGMLAANLVAFQVDEYKQHFLQTCNLFLNAHVPEDNPTGVQLEDRFVNVMSMPIGINLEALNEQRNTAEVQDIIKSLMEKYAGKRVIVARDKLDGISGVRNRLLSYEQFLKKNPALAKQVVLIQVATASSDQEDLIAKVNAAIASINGRFSTLSHQPLVFLKQDISFSHYLALLSIADVVSVGALRDGMNLTAHDFIVCQDGKYCNKKHGALILSEFTGCASLFGESAINMNPWDFKKQAEAIKEALEMSTEEKQDRWSNMNDIIRKHTGAAWAKSLALALRKVHAEQAAQDPLSIPRLSTQQTSTSYQSSKSRVFFLDFEGTLAPHRTQSGLTLSSPQKVINALNDLLEDPFNIVYVMSAKTPDELNSHFKTVSRLGIIAENGCFIRMPSDDSGPWSCYPNLDDMLEWKLAVRPVLKYYLERKDAAYIEQRHCSIVVHFENCADKEAAARTIGECANHINGTFNKMRVRAVPCRDTILIEPMDYGKAFAADQILQKLQPKNGMTDQVDFLFVAGDDREDEGIFRWANDLGKQHTTKHVCTVSLGKRNTEAHATLQQGTNGLMAVLRKLAKISADEKAANEKAASEKAASEQAASEKVADDQAAIERAANEKTTDEELVDYFSNVELVKE